MHKFTIFMVFKKKINFLTKQKPCFLQQNNLLIFLDSEKFSKVVREEGSKENKMICSTKMTFPSHRATYEASNLFSAVQIVSLMKHSQKFIIKFFSFIFEALFVTEGSVL